MKAVLYEAPHKLAFLDVPEPRLENDTIFIRVLYSYICATDIKTFKQGHPSIKPPSILGHEFSGVVEKVGPDVRLFSPGDFVTGAPFIDCGECRACVLGRPEGCSGRKFPSNGALAEFIAVPESYARKGLEKVPERIVKEAGLAEPVACVLNSCRGLDPRPGESILVVGAGFMGVLNALTLKSLFGVKCSICDTNPDRLALPEALGIRVVDAGESGGESYDSVVLAVPAVDLIPKYEALVAPFGKLVLFGGYPKDSMAQFDPNLVHYKGIEIKGSSGFSAADFRAAVSVIRGGLLKLDVFTRDLFPFSDFDVAFQAATEGRVLKAGFKL